MIKGLSTGIRITQSNTPEVEQNTKPEQSATPSISAEAAPMTPQSGSAIKAEMQMSASFQQANLLNQLEAVKLPGNTPELHPEQQNVSVTDQHTASTRSWGWPFGGSGQPTQAPLLREATHQAALTPGLTSKQDALRDASFTKLLDRKQASTWAPLPETLNTGSGNDQVDINMGTDGRVHVNVNGKEAWSGTYKEFQTLTIDTGDGNDVVTNNVRGATILTGKGDDVINNKSSETLIDTGDGDDKVTSNGWRNQIMTGEGHDSVDSSGDRNQINTDSGNDMVHSVGFDNKITTGKGGDLVESEGGDNQIRTEEGDDVVYLTRVDDREKRQYVGSDNVVDTGDGADFVSNTTRDAVIRTGEGHDIVENDGDSSRIDTGDGDDYVENTGQHAKIDTGTGDDYVKNTGGAGTSIATGEGQDLVRISRNQDYETVGDPYWDGPGPKKHVVDPIEVNAGGGDTVVNEDGSKVIINVEPK